MSNDDNDNDWYTNLAAFTNQKSEVKNNYVWLEINENEVRTYSREIHMNGQFDGNGNSKIKFLLL